MPATRPTPPSQPVNANSKPPRPTKVLRNLERGAVRAVSGFVNGLDWLQRNPTEVVDRLPFEVVAQRGLTSVRRYQPQVQDEDFQLGASMVHIEARRQRYPLLLIPPLMVQPWIFDLTPRRSLVKTLLRQGFDVFLLDFGAPKADDESVGLETYVLDWVPHAVDAVIKASGSDGLVLYGYCMGGLFALMHSAVHNDARVKAIVTIGSPIDAHKMSLVQLFVQHAHGHLQAISRRLGNVPGAVSSTAFRLTNPIKAVTRYGDLFMNLWNDDFVNDFDGITAWTSHFVDYPGDAFRQLLEQFMRDNRLQHGTMQFGDKIADLRNIHCPVLAFAGSSDKIVPPDAAREILEVIASRDKTFREVPGGHMGVMAGRAAPALVWAASASWLEERLGLREIAESTADLQG